MSIRRLAVLGAGLALGAAIFLPAVSAQQAPRQQTPADFRLAVDLVESLFGKSTLMRPRPVA